MYIYIYIHTYISIYTYIYMYHNKISLLILEAWKTASAREAILPRFLPSCVVLRGRAEKAHGSSGNFLAWKSLLFSKERSSFFFWGCE